jgi:hypothetical protein
MADARSAPSHPPQRAAQMHAPVKPRASGAPIPHENPIPELEPTSRGRRAATETRARSVCAYVQKAAELEKRVDERGSRALEDSPRTIRTPCHAQTTPRKITQPSTALILASSAPDAQWHARSSRSDCGGTNQGFPRKAPSWQVNHTQSPPGHDSPHRKRGHPHH